MSTYTYELTLEEALKLIEKYSPRKIAVWWDTITYKKAVVGCSLDGGSLMVIVKDDIDYREVTRAIAGKGYNIIYEREMDYKKARSYTAVLEKKQVTLEQFMVVKGGASGGGST